MISIGCQVRKSYGDRVELSDNHGSTASTEGVIHELAIAKPAMQTQMQVTESPTLIGLVVLQSLLKVIFWHLDPLMVSSKENTTTGK